MKKIITVIVVLALIIIGFWLFFRPEGVADEVSDTNSQVSSTWIDVESQEVTRIDEPDNALRMLVLNSGDTIEPGSIIKTNNTGAATVYFADGSSLRIEPNTTVEITEGVYEEDTSSLKVRVTLIVGKVWSKITALTTPESHWEVKTGTAVATVRGSAFGTEVTSDGETLIIGSEHDIAVAPIDQETGEAITEEEVIVSEEEVLTVDHDRKLAKLLISERLKEKPALREWIEKNEDRDQIIREKIQELKDGGLEGRELRQELRVELRREIDAKIEERIENKIEEVSERTGLPEEQIREELKERVEERTQTQSEITPIAKPTVTSLEVKTRAELKVTEGATIQFEAVAVLSDGTKKVVTDMVNWQVVGSIGTITKPGFLETKLGADVSEIGTAFGAVTASFKAESGREFLGKSEIITVIGAVADLEERG